MNNDITELLKFVGLQHYDVDKKKTTFYVDPTSSEMTVNLYLNRRITGCPFCKSTHTVIKETKEKHINHCIKPQQHLFIIFIKRNSNAKIVITLLWKTIQ